MTAYARTIGAFRWNAQAASRGETRRRTCDHSV